MVSFQENFEQIYPNKWTEFQKIGKKIQNMVQYQFGDEENLWYAMAIRGSKLPHAQFERLEFLGDSIIKAIQSLFLFERQKEFQPEQLTSSRQSLEKNVSLAPFGKELKGDEIGELLEIGKLSIDQAADYFEAIIASIFIDSNKNFEKMEKIFKSITHFEKKVKELMDSPWRFKDPRTFLNEWVQKSYSNEAEVNYEPKNEGTQNAPQYRVRVLIKRRDTQKIEIEGPWGDAVSKKKDAEKNAAERLLFKLKEEGRLDE